jgi:hypothetical protein
MAQLRTVCRRPKRDRATAPPYDIPDRFTHKRQEKIPTAAYRRAVADLGKGRPSCPACYRRPKPPALASRSCRMAIRASCLAEPERKRTAERVRAWRQRQPGGYWRRSREEEAARYREECPLLPRDCLVCGASFMSQKSASAHSSCGSSTGWRDRRRRHSGEAIQRDPYRKLLRVGYRRSQTDPPELRHLGAHHNGRYVAVPVSWVVV